MRNTIQPGDYSRGGGIDGTPYILRSPNGKRYTLYLYLNDDGKWNWNVNWLGNNRNVNDPSAVLATFFISLLLLQGSFVLRADRSNRRAFFRSRQFSKITQYIFCCLTTLFPTVP